MTTMTSVNDQTLTPTIICVAESTHYLVGAVDASHNLTSLDPSCRVAEIANSLVEAKNILRSYNIHQASLEYQTAYDEMCGASPSAPCRQTINF